MLRAAWDPPLTRNGILSYRLTISSISLVLGSSAQQRVAVNISGDEEEFLFSLISFEPYVLYTVLLQAMTGGGVSEVVMGNITSEEAGVCVCVCVYMVPIYEFEINS